MDLCPCVKVVGCCHWIIIKKVVGKEAAEFIAVFYLEGPVFSFNVTRYLRAADHEMKSRSAPSLPSCWSSCGPWSDIRSITQQNVTDEDVWVFMLMPDTPLRLLPGSKIPRCLRTLGLEEQLCFGLYFLWSWFSDFLYFDSWVQALGLMEVGLGSVQCPDEPGDSPQSGFDHQWLCTQYFSVT